MGHGKTSFEFFGVQNLQSAASSRRRRNLLNGQQVGHKRNHDLHPRGEIVKRDLSLPAIAFDDVMPQDQQARDCARQQQGPEGN
jgi:hypothetical protein